MARIIPTTDTPGATEAGTIDFLDGYLAGIDRIYAKPDGSGFETLSGRRAQAWQQRIDILRTTYVDGIADLDRRSRDTLGKPFIDLDADQQDSVLAAVERPGEAAAMNASQAVMGFAPVEPALQQASVEISTELPRRCWPCTPARASTPTRSTAATAITSAGRPSASPDRLHWPRCYTGRYTRHRVLRRRHPGAEMEINRAA